MKYMLLIYNREGCMTDAERAACMAESLRVCDELKGRGPFLDASPLHPVATAATVRVRGGQVLVTDGPFAETHEQLGGFFLIEADSIEEATKIAAQIPAGRWGTVEVRPVLQVEGLPQAASA